MKLKDLKFIKFAADGFAIESYWNVTATNSWTSDNKKGQLYAVEFLKFMRDTKSTALMSNVMRDIFRHGLTQMAQLNGVSVGFMQEIARRAIG